MLTAYGSPRMREMGRDAGCDFYFIKPLDPRKLSELVGDLSAAK